MDDQPVLGLSSRDRDEREVHAADGRLLHGVHQPAGGDVGLTAVAARQVVAERRRAGVLERELAGEVRLGDHCGAVGLEGVEAADMVQMGVREDHVGDGQLGDLAEFAERRGRVLGRTGGVDGDHSGAGDDEAHVGEVVALRHVNARCVFDQARGNWRR
nr:hypothetical protein [Microbispora sp. H10836]